MRPPVWKDRPVPILPNRLPPVDWPKRDGEEEPKGLEPPNKPPELKVEAPEDCRIQLFVSGGGACKLQVSQP